MPKILLFTDLHLDQHRMFSTTLPNGLNSRLCSQLQAIEQVASIAEKYKVGTILFLGDYFHSQMDSMSKMVYILGYEAMKHVADACEHLYIIPGNHDIYREQTVLRTFSHLGDVVTVTTNDIIEGHKFLLVPWGDTATSVMDGEYVAGHLSIIGAKLNNLSSVEATEGIKARSLTAFRKVLSGHYHIKHALGPNIEYIGSVNPIGFGELGAPGYVTLFDPDTAVVESIELKVPRFFYITIDTEADMDRFITGRSPTNYYKLLITSRAVPVPDLDERVIAEYRVEEKVEARLEVQEEPVEELMFKFIDMVDSKVDKDEVKREFAQIMEGAK